MLEKLLILILVQLLITIILFMVFSYYYKAKKTRKNTILVDDDKNNTVDINNIDIDKYIENTLIREGYNLNIVDVDNFKINVYKYQRFNYLKLKVLVKVKEFTYDIKDELINEVDRYLEKYHNIGKKYATIIIFPKKETEDFINFFNEGTIQSYLTSHSFTVKIYAGICIQTKKIYFGVNDKSSHLIVKYLQLKNYFKELIEPFSDAYDANNN